MTDLGGVDRKGLHPVAIDPIHRALPRLDPLLSIHPAERFTGLAWLLHPGEEARAQEPARQWCGLLKSEGGALLSAVLEEWDGPKRPGLGEAVADWVRYLGRHALRMGYPDDLDRGWCIGSGAVEREGPVGSILETATSAPTDRLYHRLT